MPSIPLRFDYVPYPLWRRRMPGWLRTVSRPLLRRAYPVDTDERPPAAPEAVARYLTRWNLLQGMSEAEALRAMTDNPATVEDATGRDEPPLHPYSRANPVRLPAQWEPTESIILTWPLLYPPLWALSAQMVEAIAPVANVSILVSAPLYASAVKLFLTRRSHLPLERIRFLHLPTDDIWVRDYGPIVGLDDEGRQVVVSAIFDPLPGYPQARDNAMAERWAAHEGIPVQALDLHLEGGNIWSDGVGTLILSRQVLRSNPGLTHDGLLEKLHRVFSFEKLILTPRLKLEETGHVDLLVKLADVQTVLVSVPTSPYNGANLREAAAIFRRETNAQGQPYQVYELPSPAMYFNWFAFAIWPSYTNALTVNGRVLVPTYGLDSDDEALAIYARALPNCEVIPIDCRVSINGGGAVHCLTKEVPRALA